VTRSKVCHLDRLKNKNEERSFLRIRILISRGFLTILFLKVKTFSTWQRIMRARQNFYGIDLVQDMVLHDRQVTCNLFQKVMVFVEALLHNILRNKLCLKRGFRMDSKNINTK
jgi:hypothetical protein